MSSVLRGRRVRRRRRRLFFYNESIWAAEDRDETMFVDCTMLCAARQLLYRVGSHKISRDATNPRETDF